MHGAHQHHLERAGRVVPVNIVEHLLARVKQRVQGANALVRHHDTALAVDVGVDAIAAGEVLMHDDADRPDLRLSRM